MKRKVIIIAIVIPVFLSGIYFINHSKNLGKVFENTDNKEKVVQALQNYNKIDGNTNKQNVKNISFNTDRKSVV